MNMNISMDNEDGPDEAFQVDSWVHFLGGMVERRKGLWKRFGGWETRMLSDHLAGTTVEQPVYIAGLARSGTTKLLEVLDWHPEVVTHRYRDFPLLYTPYLWNRFLDFMPRRDVDAAERAHKDGILVTPDSPEAFEEVLWMAFFPELHDPASNSVLDAATDNPDFESFYRDHIRKLLLVRGGRRYVSKGNYNVTRLEYLLKIFPTARFVIPVRDPFWHIASLMKQHRIFCEGQQDNPRAVLHLQRVGHFEFGLDRRPINADDDDEVGVIQDLWERGREVEAWARYWNHTHAYLAARLEQEPALRRAAFVVRYEDLCRAPGETMASIFAHCGLSVPHQLRRRADRSIRFPGYYRPDFSRQEVDVIHRCTGETAARFGLAPRRHQPRSGFAGRRINGAGVRAGYVPSGR